MAAGDLERELRALHEGVGKALGDPKRLLIITLLGSGELTVSDLCEAVDASQSNVSQHLAVLRERGIVAGRREGTAVYYSLVSRKILQAIDLLREFDRETGTTAAPADARVSSVFLG